MKSNDLKVRSSRCALDLILLMESIADRLKLAANAEAACRMPAWVVRGDVVVSGQNERRNVSFNCACSVKVQSLPVYVSRHFTGRETGCGCAPETRRV